jgi:hypothetical protein
VAAARIHAGGTMKKKKKKKRGSRSTSASRKATWPLSRQLAAPEAGRPLPGSQILPISRAQRSCRADAPNWLHGPRDSNWRPDVARKYTRRSGIGAAG